jgi:hypothetical protein
MNKNYFIKCENNGDLIVFNSDYISEIENLHPVADYAMQVRTGGYRGVLVDGWIDNDGKNKFQIRCDSNTPEGQVILKMQSGYGRDETLHLYEDGFVEIEKQYNERAESYVSLLPSLK